MILPAPNQDSMPCIPTSLEIQQCTQEKFGVRSCLWQLKVAKAFLKGDKDIVCIAGTSMGKTLGFWLPLLFHLNGIQIVVTLLNLLGKQNPASLARASIWAISISSETATPCNFTVSIQLGVVKSELTLRLKGNWDLSIPGNHCEPWAIDKAQWWVQKAAQKLSICIMDHQCHHWWSTLPYWLGWILTGVQGASTSAIYSTKHHSDHDHVSNTDQGLIF